MKEKNTKKDKDKDCGKHDFIKETKFSKYIGGNAYFRNFLYCRKCGKIIELHFD